MEAAKLFTFRKAETLQQSSSIANLILTKNAFHRIIGPRSGVPPIFIFSVNVGNRTDFKLAACQDACIASFGKNGRLATERVLHSPVRKTAERAAICSHRVNSVSSDGEYRAYVIGPDGHFLWSDEFVATDDDAALELARQLVDGHDVVLWSGPRFVANLKSSSEK